MRKCYVCGKRFKLIKDQLYIIKKEPVGLNCLTEGIKYIECFDCPKCGCQNMVNIRECGEERSVYEMGEEIAAGFAKGMENLNE